MRVRAWLRVRRLRTEHCQPLLEVRSGEALAERVEDVVGDLAGAAESA